MQEKLQRHHYVPKFYLAKWRIDKEDLLLVHTRTENGRIHIGRKSPYSVSFVRGLYTAHPELHPFDQKPSNRIESEFFSRLDADASEVHQKILSNGISKLTVEERFVWCVFMNSILERSPQRINEILAYATQSATQLIESVKPKVNGSEGLNLSFLSNINIEAVTRNSVLTGMVNWICDEQTIQYFNSMEWVIITLPEKADHFLTGDTPIIVNGGNGEKTPVYILSIALSPRKLLIMHKESMDFDEEFLVKLSMMHNILIVEQTQKYLISSKVLTDDGFVKNKKILETMYRATVKEKKS